jgi:hypothetical protein
MVVESIKLMSVSMIFRLDFGTVLTIFIMTITIICNLISSLLIINTLIFSLMTP